MASDDIMTAGAGGATATVRADIKAAFFDIDGTLTSFVTHVIPQSSIDALHELQDRGVKVFICSGRAPSHMTVVLDMMPVHFDGIIALNGQYCFDDHGLLEKESLLPEDIVTITRWLDEHPDVVANYCEKDYVYFIQITDAMRASVLAAGNWARPAWMILPRYRPGVDARLEAMGSGAAFLQIADNAMNYHILGSHGFAAVGRMVDHCRSFNFEYSRLDEAIAIFDRLAREAEGEAP